MTAPTFSSRQTRVLQITGACLLIFNLGFGLFYQVMKLKLDGVVLIGVCVLIINYVNLLQSQLRQASVRIDELEKKLAVR